MSESGNSIDLGVDMQAPKRPRELHHHLGHAQGDNEFCTLTLTIVVR